MSPPSADPLRVSRSAISSPRDSGPSPRSCPIPSSPISLSFAIYPLPLSDHILPYSDLILSYLILRLVLLLLLVLLILLLSYLILRLLLLLLHLLRLVLPSSPPPSTGRLPPSPLKPIWPTTRPAPRPTPANAAPWARRDVAAFAAGGTRALAAPRPRGLWALRVALGPRPLAVGAPRLRCAC